MKTELQKVGIVFTVGFFLYIGLEVIWRTFTNFNGLVPPKGLLIMGFLGGFVAVILGYINEIRPLRKLPFWLHCIIGAVIITGLEWLTGFIVNVNLGWNVWDYKHLILSTPDGQINLFFSLIWLILSPVAFYIDDHLRTLYEYLRTNPVSYLGLTNNIKSQLKNRRSERQWLIQKDLMKSKRNLKL